MNQVHQNILVHSNETALTSGQRNRLRSRHYNCSASSGGTVFLHRCRYSLSKWYCWTRNHSFAKTTVSATRIFHRNMARKRTLNISKAVVESEHPSEWGNSFTLTRTYHTELLRSRCIHDNGVVYHEIDWINWVDFGWISAKLFHSVSHRGKVNDDRHTPKNHLL